MTCDATTTHANWGRTPMMAARKQSSVADTVATRPTRPLDALAVFIRRLRTTTLLAWASQGGSGRFDSDLSRCTLQFGESSHETGLTTMATAAGSPTDAMLTPALWLGADCEQVCAQAAKGWLRFDGSGGEQHLLAPIRVRPVFLHEPARSFDSVQRHRVEACTPDFGYELFGAVEVGGGEPLGVANRVGFRCWPSTRSYSAIARKGDRDDVVGCGFSEGSLYRCAGSVVHVATPDS